ncbi:MAG: PepSY-associated TM helix domain-containing protein [Pseudomonadota bacterium]
MADTERILPETASKPQPKKKKKTAKRKLYDLHTWLGFHLALIMSLVLFTGTVATISDEIDWMFQHDMRVTPDGDKVSWGDIETAVRAYAPNDMLTLLATGEGDHFAYRASMLRPNGQRYFIHVDQWTGEVTGTTHSLTVQRFFRDLHRYLFMPSFPGIIIVCSLAFVLAVSLYTGLKTTGKIRTVATRLRRDKGTRIMIGDFHKAVGVWSVWFFVVIIATGIWYLAEFGAAVGGTSFEPSRPGVTEERVVEYGDVMRVIPADEIIARTKEAFPELEPKMIFYPRLPQHAISVWGRAGDVLVRSRANRVFLDAVDGSVIKVQKSGEIGWVAYLNEIADPLHFGSFGLLPTKLIWFVFGLAMTALSLTGVWLTYRRLKKVMVSKSQFATMPVLLVTMILGSMYIDRYIGADEPGSLIELQSDHVGGFLLESSWQIGEETGNHFIQLNISHPDGRPMVTSARLVDPQGGTEDLRFRTFDNTTILRASLAGGRLKQGDTISLNVELATGKQLAQVLRYP